MGKLFYIPKIVLNFQVNQFSTFWQTWTFMYWLEIANFEPKFDILKVTGGLHVPQKK